MLLVLVFKFSHYLVKFVAFLAMREPEGLCHVREGERVGLKSNNTKEVHTLV